MATETALRALLDVAVRHAECDNGHLGDDDVAAMREAAEALGIEPMNATPGAWKCRYRRHHEARPDLDRRIFTSWPDGIQRNTYEHVDGSLVIVRAHVVVMWCPDCGRTWGAFEDTAWREEAA